MCLRHAAVAVVVVVIALSLPRILGGIPKKASQPESRSRPQSPESHQPPPSKTPKRDSPESDLPLNILPSNSRPLPDSAERARGLQPGDTITVAAYLFGVDADEPRIVQVTCTLMEPEDEGYMWHRRKYEDHVQWPRVGHAWVQHETHSRTAPLLLHSLSLAFHEYGLLDNQRPNRCIEKLVGGPGKAHHHWVGDFMLFRDEVTDRYCDITEEDLAPAISFFRDYGRFVWI